MTKLKVLITGGAGFIGTNAAARYICEGHEVTILDNLSRKGSETNMKWLKGIGEFEFLRANVEDKSLLQTFFQKHTFDLIFHLAAQVAVTSSVIDPVNDFSVNAYGTLLILDAIRQTSPDAIFIYSSTNKVYGSLKDIELYEEQTCYRYAQRYRKGITEDQPLDFHSPYGCSKGCGDQYVRDYARIYGMKTVVMRQSCIYGPHQFGIVDQGWVAWIISRAISGQPITVFGSGKQVRDVLHIKDLLDVYDCVVKDIEIAKGKIYNIGGGPENKISVLELIGLSEMMMQNSVKYTFSDERPGDQRIYVSDISKVYQELGWKPCIRLQNGIQELFDWIKESGSC